MKDKRKNLEIGHEYIIEAFGEEFLDKKLYFVCLLCDQTQKHSVLHEHLTSAAHQIKFLVSLERNSNKNLRFFTKQAKNFPKTFNLIEALKDEDRQYVLEYVVRDILRNNSPQKSYEWNYAEYEDSSDTINEEILQKAVKYDNDLCYVSEINQLVEMSTLDDTGDLDEDEAKAGDEEIKESSKKHENQAENQESAENSQDHLDDSRCEALVSMYQEKVKKIQQKLRDDFQKYIKNPWIYPGFESEWRKFYIEKSYNLALLNQILSAPINYLPGWFEYWPRRVHEIKQQKLVMAKQQLRQDHHLPDTIQDLSDDEIYESAPKKAKFEPEYDPELTSTLSYHPSDPVMTPKPSNLTPAEVDRIVFAYNVAYENFLQGKRSSALEVVETVKEHFSAAKLKEAEETSKDSVLSDNDLLMLFKNFSNLNGHEKENFLALLRCIESSDPIRHERLKQMMRRQRMVQKF